MTTRKIALVALVVASVSALSIGAVAAVSTGGSTPGQVEAPVQAADELAASNIGVLKQPRTAADRLPAATATSAVAQIPYGANVELSQRVAEDATHAVYAVPAHDYVCMVVPDADGSTTSCTLTKDIIGGTAGPSLILRGDVATLYAVVPDGVKDVTLHTGDGKNTAVPVQDGAYLVDVPASARPETITYNGPSGPVSQRVPMPPTVPTPANG